MEKVNIIRLMQNNSKTRFSKDYENKLLNKVKDRFSPEEQIFLSNYYLFLKYNPEKDFVVDFDMLWKLLEFPRKEQAKRLLEKHFTIDVDYKVEKEDKKEKIMLTVNTYKKFCMKAGTKKSDDFITYYLKMQDLLIEITNEQTDEIRKQIQKFDKLTI